VDVRARVVLARRQKNKYFLVGINNFWGGFGTHGIKFVNHGTEVFRGTLLNVTENSNAIFANLIKLLGPVRTTTEVLKTEVSL